MATEGTGKAVSADLGQTFKISPGVIIAKKSTFAVCDIKGSGEVRHVWVTCAPVGFQDIVAEFFYDGADFPSVSMPLGKLFAIGDVRILKENNRRKKLLQTRRIKS